jgi:hypothetical protein
MGILGVARGTKKPTAEHFVDLSSRLIIYHNEAQFLVIIRFFRHLSVHGHSCASMRP